MDKILARFLQESWRNAEALANASDLLTLVPFGSPPQAVIAQFDACFYAQTSSGVLIRRGFVVGYRFSEQYLWRALPWEVLQVMTPGLWHPNIRTPAICLGSGLQPGTELRELLFRTYELVTYQRRCNPADPLNTEASAWVRQNWPVKPSDARPLKWRASPESSVAHASN
jgi:hypothetical protein